MRRIEMLITLEGGEDGMQFIKQNVIIHSIINIISSSQNLFYHTLINAIF